MVVDLNESMKSYGTQVEEKIAQLGKHQKRGVQERKSLRLELEGVRAAAVGSNTMCEGLFHELANLRVSVETEFTTQAVVNASRELAFLHDLSVGREEKEKVSGRLSSLSSQRPKGSGWKQSGQPPQEPPKK